MHVFNCLLTPREIEVLQLLTGGWRYDEIATQLGIKLATVKTHTYHLRKKCGDRTTMQIAAEFVRQETIQRMS